MMQGWPIVSLLVLRTPTVTAPPMILGPRSQRVAAPPAIACELGVADAYELTPQWQVARLVKRTGAQLLAPSLGR